MTVQDKLDAMIEHAESWSHVDMHSDIHTLVAALRAVLDLHGEVEAPRCDCLSPHCKCGHVWPCIDLADVTEVITAALDNPTQVKPGRG